MPSAIYEHLGSRQFSRLIYGAIVALGLIVALEHEEPGAAVMAGTLVGTGIAIGLTELYSEFLGTEVAARRRVDRAPFREMAAKRRGGDLRSELPRALLRARGGRGHEDRYCFRYLPNGPGSP